MNLNIVYREVEALSADLGQIAGFLAAYENRKEELSGETNPFDHEGLRQDIVFCLERLEALDGYLDPGE